MRFLKVGSQVFSILGQNGVGRFNVASAVSRPHAQVKILAPVASYRTLPWKEPSIDELPVPEGSWDTANKKMQQKYNRHLYLGTGFFFVTLFVLFTSGLVQFNATIPKLDPEYLAKGSGCDPTPPKC